MKPRESRLKDPRESGARRYMAPSHAGSQDPAERLRALEEEARERGFREGFEEGRRLADEETTARLAQLASSIERLVTLRSETIREAEQDLLRLAVRIAEAVVRARVETDSEMVVRALRDAIAEVPAAETLTVRCHPEDEAVLAGWLGRSGQGPSAVTLRPDPALSRGGCVVESGAGQIDVRVETQLRVIEHELVSRS